MIDPTDMAILKALNQNCRIKVNHLAELVHLTAPAVAARIANLEATGVIKNYTIETDLTQIGYPLQVFIQVKLLATKQTAYLTFIREHRNDIRHHYQTTGEMNYLIEGAFTSREKLKAFLDALSKFASYRVTDVLAEQF
ncbi:Lrp/AsnC family transcriptional regulator [Lactiplantibacillus nangangensis]|uniref:Lrp/AsnC family transcriptional regulator n=1 Tax=Lactiplantibacillus nangangensis TaxID=2559917 RepID=A0ABW1SKR4_9LACO|nr:Lrp/AsnC family transcriptional regulator [Lactiplantibacillus nangangensis]